ncbi:MAG: hypothetical protein LIP12_13115 [Clostridiales bacterium]|nr:hypothetical protein [Clostridiales bacterium]
MQEIEKICLKILKSAKMTAAESAFAGLPRFPLSLAPNAVKEALNSEKWIEEMEGGML